MAILYCNSTSENHMAIKAHHHRSTSTLQIDKRIPHGHCYQHGWKQMSLLHCCSRYAYIHIYIYIHVCIYNYIHIYMSIYTGASPQVNKNLANRQAKPTWPLLSAWLKTNVIVALLLSLCIHTYIYMCIYIYNYIHIYIYMSIYTVHIQCNSRCDNVYHCSLPTVSSLPTMSYSVHSPTQKCREGQVQQQTVCCRLTWSTHMWQEHMLSRPEHIHSQDSWPNDCAQRQSWPCSE